MLTFSLGTLEEFHQFHSKPEKLLETQRRE